MEYCFWIIVTLMTGLTQSSSTRFELVVQKGNNLQHYIIFRQDSVHWNLRYPTGVPGDTVNVVMHASTDFMEMNTSFINKPIRLQDYFTDKKVNWAKVKKFTFNKAYKEEGEEDLEIMRMERQIYIRQEKGSFTYFPVIYTRW